jgi:hypothetical protein
MDTGDFQDAYHILVDKVDVLGYGLVGALIELGARDLLREVKTWTMRNETKRARYWVVELYSGMCAFIYAPKAQAPDDLWMTVEEMRPNIAAPITRAQAHDLYEAQYAKDSPIKDLP